VTIKAGKELIDFVTLCYYADRAPLLVGQHGVGKSEILAQAAAELGIGFLVRDLSLMEPPDLIGLPKIDGNVTRFLPPAFLPTGGKGLLVFEELNRCALYMRGPTLQLLTARTLNDYQLPAGWLPAAAVNPADDGYEVDELDRALLSRFVQVNVEASPHEWLTWAKTQGVHGDVLAYVAADPSVFDGAQSNPRAWKYASDLLHAVEQRSLGAAGKRTLEVALAGTVGRERAAAFHEFRKGGELPPEAKPLLADYPRHRPRVRAWAEEGKTDVLACLANRVQGLLQSQQEYERVRRNKASWKALGDFLQDLPGDLARQVRDFMSEWGHEPPPQRQQRQGGRKP
jgi:hypothetical protein